MDETGCFWRSLPEETLARSTLREEGALGEKTLSKDLHWYSLEKQKGRNKTLLLLASQSVRGAKPA